MGLFDLFKKDTVKETLPEVKDTDIVAVCTGELIENAKIADDAFASEVMGQTIAIEPSEGVVGSPVNGTIEALFPTGHAFAVRGKDDTGYLVHIGIDTVSMNGDGFKVLKKDGDTVKAGEPIVKIDLAKIKAANHPATTMIIITEPVDDKAYSFIGTGKVTKNQVISK